jgi:hypothetical protein
MLNVMLKVKYSLISALVFFIVANPEFYKITQWAFGGFFQVAHPMGAATPAGMLLHTVLFFGAMFGLMAIPNL